MRPMCFATRTVVDRMERDPEFARFVHESEATYIRNGTDGAEEDEPIEIVYRQPAHPDWAIRIVTNWDRSRTTICFPGEELDDAL